MTKLNTVLGGIVWSLVSLVLVAAVFEPVSSTEHAAVSAIASL